MRRSAYHHGLVRACQTDVLRTLLLWLTTGLPLCAAAAAPGCAGEALPVEVGDGVLQVRLGAGERASLWIEELGVDIELQLDDGHPVDSAPGRHAAEPVTVRADAAGVARIRYRSLSGSGEPAVQARRRCSGATLDGLIDRFAEQQRAAIGRGEPQAALAALAIAATVRAFAPSDDVRLQGWLAMQLAWLARSGGYLQEARALYRSAELRSATVGDPIGAAWARLGAAQAAMNLGDPDSGAELQAAASSAADAGLPFAAAIAAHDGCIWQRLRGDTAQAAECLAGVAARFSALGEAREQARALGNRATALQMLGRYRDARAELDRAAAAAPELEPRMAAMLAGQRAQAARLAGRYSDALELLRDGLARLDHDAHPLDRAHLLRLLGQTYAVAGEPVRALDYFDAALGIYRARGVDARAAAVQVTMARVLEAQGEYRRAVELLQPAAAALSSHGSRNEALLAALHLARLRWLVGDAAASRDLLLRLHGSETGASWLYFAERELLRVRIEPPDRSAAIEQRLRPLLQRAQASGLLLLQLDIAHALVEQRIARGDREGAMALALEQMQGANDVLARLHSPGLRHALLRRIKPLALASLLQSPSAPLSVEQASAALALVDWMRRSGSGRTAAAFDDDRLGAVERLLTEELLSGEPAEPARRNELMLALQSAPHDSDDGLRERPEPPLLPALEPGEALLYFGLGDRSAGVMIGTDRQWRWHAGLDPQALRSAIGELHAALADGHGALAGIETASAALADALQWDRLLDTTPTRLYVVADAELAALPWAALPRRDGAGPLGAATGIVLLQQLQPQPQRPLRQVRVISAEPAPGQPLAVLPEAADEPAAIAAKWRDRLPVTRLPADLDGIQTGLSAPDGIVHIAAHARADRGLVEESGLWLHDPGRAALRFVSALRLRQIDQRASLVVISACETGYSLSATSFGMGGVAGATVDAGSQAVVSALWPVSDRAARVFSEAFHAALADAEPAPAALQRAIERLRATPALRHPTHWAGWTLLQAGPLLATDR